MKSLSPEHEFWTKLMVNAHDHYATDYEADSVAKNLSESTRTSATRDPCRAAMKGFRNVTHALSGPIIETSCPGKSYEREQNKIKEFFYRNPTPARIEEEFVDETKPQIPVHSANAPIPPATAAVPPAAAQIPTQEFYTQLLKTMKVLRQAPPQQQKIVVKLREHKDSVDLAKLHNNMLMLFYVNGKINWEEGTVKNINLATFAQGFANLLSRTAIVQETQFANLLNTVFTTQPNNDSDNLANPLERMMSLTVSPKRFTKAHLNASFQCADLEAGLMYKNPSINPFHYGLQTNRALVKAASAEIQEEHNKINWKINDKDKKVISSVIEGVQRIKTMDDVCMTCANMCRVMLAIVDINKSKPLLYQVAWKFIKLIKNRKMKTWMRKNSDNIAHLPFVFMAKIHQFFQSFSLFSQNSINTNKVELNNLSLDMKQIAAAVKLVTKFVKKMIEHADNNLVPKEIPPFAKSFFVEQGSRTITIAPSADLTSSTTQPTVTSKGKKCKSDTTNPGAKKKKTKRETSFKSLKMGLYHVKKGTTVAKALPDKSTLKGGKGVCMDFCTLKRKCNYPHQICMNGKHYTNWKNVPDKDKPVLLLHMDSTGLLWFDKETMKKHNNEIAPKYAYLLRDATGPKPKKPTRST
jgi:hypothetical protein